MSPDLPAVEYVFIREGCQFAFPEATDHGAPIDFDQAPAHLRFAFQGRALVQFMLACIQLEEAKRNNPEQFAWLRLVEQDIGQEWKDAGLP